MSPKLEAWRQKHLGGKVPQVVTAPPTIEQLRGYLAPGCSCYCCEGLRKDIERLEQANEKKSA